MRKITLSLYIKTIREYSKNHRRSFQSILGDLFGIINDIGNYFVESTTSSRIMNGEYDVPYQIRESFIRKNDEEKMSTSNEFIGSMVDESSMDMLLGEIKMIVNESNVSARTKNNLACEGDYHKILSSFLSIAIISDNRTILDETLYKDNNGSITLLAGDLLALGFNKKMAKSERIVVIPVDDRFTMVFKSQDGEEMISKDSIHGKWLLRLNKMGIESPKIKYVKIGNVKIGKTKIEQTEFYLLPVSSLKERYKAESNLEMINDAINALATEYNIAGQGIPIYVPLIGTGRSRVRLSLKESINLIKDTFTKNDNGFFGELKIVVHPKNVDELED